MLWIGPSRTSQSSKVFSRAVPGATRPGTDGTSNFVSEKGDFSHRPMNGVLEEATQRCPLQAGRGRMSSIRRCVMPRGDGTGPTGQGPMTGRGMGGGAGRGMGTGGKGRMGGRGLGPGGECVCPQCGTRAPHERGVPCFQQKCPQCGNQMTRA